MSTLLCKICPKCKISIDILYFDKYLSCRKCRNKINRERYAKNPEKYLNYSKKWKKNNPDKSKKYDFHIYYAQRRRKVLDAYGNKCVCCGETEEKFLTLDHKNNDGNIDRKKYGSGYSYYFVIKYGFPDTYQLLCYNCNNAKFRYKICPHQSCKNS